MNQLQWLTRPVISAGPGALAIATYAEARSADDGRPNRLRPARERGMEGVACVDDAARAVVLLCRRGSSEDAAVAAGLLRFLACMQDADGRMVNFILDWSGTQNRTGATSEPGGPSWQARAVHALACAASAFGGHEWNERYLRGVQWLDGALPCLDVRSVAVLAAVEHWRATASSLSAERAKVWCEEIAAHRQAGRLLNAAGMEAIHLWGHLQEAALVAAGCAFGRRDFVDAARESADHLLVPAARGFETAGTVLPFDVSCVIAGLQAVAAVTAEARYAAAAGRAQAWFHGYNAARQPVWDQRQGRVYDGIDDGRVSRNSGAESNIEGALALLSGMAMPASPSVLA